MNNLKKEIIIFLKHLRLNYQIIILSAPFLLGGLLSPMSNINIFLLQYFSVHVLLFGGVTAYNSYWDKDKGPIGGLKNPQAMKHWMLIVSWLMQIIGLCLSIISGIWMFISYILSITLFWVYSGPNTRWKEKPMLALLTMSLGTAFLAVLMGYFAGGGENISLNIIVASIGCSLFVLAMYPFSQAYQLEDDKKKSHNTFCVKYGKKGVFITYVTAFPLAILILSTLLWKISYIYGIIFLIGSIIAGIMIFFIINSLQMKRADYNSVMLSKYVAGAIFSIYIIVLMIMKFLIW